MAVSDGLVYQQTNCCPPWCFFLWRLTVQRTQSVLTAKWKGLCDWRHVSDPLPTRYLCRFVLAGVLIFVLGATFIDVLSQPVACLNAPFGNL